MKRLISETSHSPLEFLQLIATFLLFGIFVLISPVWGQITPQDVWLSMDFDSPLFVSGQMVDAELNPASLVPGRTTLSGAAYRFVRSRSNKLTHEQAAAAVFVLKSGDSDWSLESPFSVQGSHVTPKTAITFSAYVAPDEALKGTRVRLTVDVAAPEEKDRQKLEKDLKDNTNPRLALVPDQSMPQEIELTGKLQRIAAYCIVDNRLSKRTVIVRLRKAEKTPQSTDVPATADVPLKLERLMLEQTHFYPHFTFAPSVWVDGLQNVGENRIIIRDPGLIKSFPVESGTAAFWFHDIQDSGLTNNQHGFFSLKRGWYSDGVYLFNESATSGVKTALQFAPILTEADSGWTEADSGWTHLILSWEANEIRLYRDGKRLASAARDTNQLPESLDKYIFCIGGTTPEGVSASGDMDDFLILRRALDDLEAAQLFNLSRSGTQIDLPVRVSGLDRTCYYRNESNAQLVLSVFSKNERQIDVEAKIGARSLGSQRAHLKAGETEIAIPFSPADCGAGDFPVLITGRQSLSKPAKAEETLKAEETEETNKAEKMEKESESLNTETTDVFAKTAEIRVLPRLDREQFKLLSWGGSQSTPIEYLLLIGINSVNVNWDSAQQIETCSQAGLFVNIRVENSRIFSANGYDLSEVERQTRRRLAPYRNYYNWKTTLVNSEVYGSGLLKDLERNAKWTAWARDTLQKTYQDSIGREVELRFDQTHAPAEIPYFKNAAIPPEGIIDESDTLLSLRWFMDSGMPPYQCNRLTRELVRELQPDNIVWSEPCMSGGMFDALDMAADWMYAYDLADFYRELKKSWCVVRNGDKRFMPTVTMGHWPVLTGKQPELSASTEDAAKDAKGAKNVKDAAKDVKPAEKEEAKPITINATVDELRIKSALCIAAVPADALSFFSVDSWSFNETKYRPQGNESPRNAPEGTVESDAGARFGQYVRSELLPMATLLRNIPVVERQTPIAVVLPESTGYYSGLWWGMYHYTTAIMHALGESGLDYDIIYDRDMDANRLKTYRMVLFPAGKIVTRKNYEILKQADASPNTLLVVDRYCSQNFPNALKLDNLYYDYANRQKTTTEPIHELIANHLSMLTERLPLWAQSVEEVSKEVAPEVALEVAPKNGENGSQAIVKQKADDQMSVLRFLREYNGIQYAVVINNARTTGPFNAYLPDKDWYRPYGKAQRITTRIRLSDLGFPPEQAGPTIYSFLTGKPIKYQRENGFAVITEDFAAAETKIYCVYPKPLSPVLATINREKNRVELQQKYTDGTWPGGRQTVRVKVLDSSGKQRDESGLYTLERGVGAVPLYGLGDVTVQIE